MRVTNAFWVTIFFSLFLSSCFSASDEELAGNAALADQLVHDSAVLVSNTRSCGGGVVCEAVFLVNLTSLSSDYDVSSVATISFEDKAGGVSPVVLSVDFEVGTLQQVTYERFVDVCDEVDYGNGTVIDDCARELQNVTVEEPVYSGKLVKPGIVYVRLWSDDAPEDFWVDWNILIEDLGVKVNDQDVLVSFDSHKKGWAVWSGSNLYENDFEVDVDDWSESEQPSAGDFGQTTEQAHGGSSSLYFNDTLSGTRYTLRQNFTAQTGTVIYDFWYRSPDSNQGLTVRMTEGGPSTVAANMNFWSGDTTLRIDNLTGGWTTIGTHRQNSWTNIRWEYNRSTRHMMVWENGTKLCGDSGHCLALTSAPSTVDIAHISEGNSNNDQTNFFFDNFCIGNGPDDCREQDGFLTIDLITPTVNGNVTQLEFFEWTMEITCNAGPADGGCGNVTAFLDPHEVFG